ncbi:hypothetical protein OSB04_008030 [Centaurea solstitialis]|uniref:DNA topoisomerase (ATP-hydrolyzing) n=1 Tax=Centaurea solstitialis TaxID=347529 RepID=A0AA38TXM1_9ASTR|nr:hypothetical protein OSB04_008030 [Centaurea solstitialis]
MLTKGRPGSAANHFHFCQAIKLREHFVTVCLFFVVHDGPNFDLDKIQRYCDFINKELCHFFRFDLQRSIPSLVDGLKVVERKILFYAFEKGIFKEITIQEFFGYVSENTAYRHGEEILVNGSGGIGTGWSSFIPKYHPLEIIENLRNMLHDRKACVIIKPWYKGFNEEIKKITKETYTIQGSTQVIEPNTVLIFELPIKTWTDHYRISHTRKSDDKTVNFEVLLSAEQMAEANREGIYKKLKLISNLKLTNMDLLGTNGREATKRSKSSLNPDVGGGDEDRGEDDNGDATAGSNIVVEGVQGVDDGDGHRDGDRREEHEEASDGHHGEGHGDDVGVGDEDRGEDDNGDATAESNINLDVVEGVDNNGDEGDRREENEEANADDGDGEEDVHEEEADDGDGHHGEGDGDGERREANADDGDGDGREGEEDVHEEEEDDGDGHHGGHGDDVGGGDEDRGEDDNGDATAGSNIVVERVHGLDNGDGHRDGDRREKHEEANADDGDGDGREGEEDVHEEEADDGYDGHHGEGDGDGEHGGESGNDGDGEESGNDGDGEESDDDFELADDGDGGHGLDHCALIYFSLTPYMTGKAMANSALNSTGD